ncbi:hypothetical protein CEQ90_13700 [Lewinellaceae bacterium SD302]|nr:hypothetical protein CEQ90_13700 [Lewinellaceae bacterium SD302]
MLFRLLRRSLLFAVLTITSQVGGLVYLIYYPLGRRIAGKVKNAWLSRLTRLAIFSGLMLLTSLVIVPPLARQFGRVPLPLSANSEHPLRPGSWFFVVANRHYVKSPLADLLKETANQLALKYSGAELLYLDAGFPFFTGFPLLPHLSHDDGEKADLAFVYRKGDSPQWQTSLATLLGYGFYTGPRGEEFDMPERCASQGYWQYDLLGKMAFKHPDYTFDEAANTYLIRTLVRDKRVRKVFIEPHLKTRLGLSERAKVRFHGCRAVRHDDHIHVEL